MSKLTDKKIRVLQKSLLLVSLVITFLLVLHTDPDADAVVISYNVSTD